MNDFIFSCPTKFVFGQGYTDKVGEEISEFAWNRGIILSGGASAEKSGTLERVRKSLKKAGIDYVEYSGVRPNPEVKQVHESIKLARDNDVDFVLAVGGGSTIDAAKATAYGYYYEGDVWDFHEGKAKISKMLPIAAIPTIPAAGSESSSSCVISNDAIQIKKGTDSQLSRPKLAIMDPELTFTLPQYQTAAGVADMISHICERYFSGTGQSAISDNFSTGLIRAIIDAALIVKDQPDCYDARATLMWASTLAHNDITGCGLNSIPEIRAGGWENHALEHAMSAVNVKVTHGAGLAVIMPAWMRYVWKEDAKRFLKFGYDVFGIKPKNEDNNSIEAAVCEIIDSLQNFFVELGLPRTMTELGLTNEDIDPIIASVKHTKGLEFGSFKILSLEDARKIYESAL